MKQKSIIAALLLLVAGMQTARGQKMTVNLTNGKTVVYRLSKVESVAFDDTPTEFTYVDLGLPSGTLWATFNIGAEDPEDYGYYFAWGETQPKDRYTLKTYRWMTEGKDSWEYINKYTIADGQTDGIWYNSGGVFVGDGKSVLETEDDAATVNWGNEWKMPTVGQFHELISDDYTTREVTTLNDVTGIKVTSKANGNSIFLPAAGSKYYEDLNSEGENALFWTCSVNPDNSSTASCCKFYWDGTSGLYNFDRCYGNSIRPVSSAATKPFLVTRIMLSESSLFLNVDDIKQLTADVLPTYADNREVAWESSDPDVAEVSKKGKVYANGYGSCTITCRATDGSNVKAECQVTVEMPDTHDYVDLGLPSGTLWAACNIGAERPEQSGDYFAWGETQPKSDYSWTYYKWMNEGQSGWTNINKYTFADLQKQGCWYDGDTFIGDGMKELLPVDDAATANWGRNWQMPTKEQCDELTSSANTLTEWTTENGVQGLKVTSKTNGNSIFLPAAGDMNGSNLEDDDAKGQYWTRTIYTNYSDYGWSMFAGPNSFSLTGISRYYGHSVRAVRVKEDAHDYVDLGLPSGTLWATCNIGANSPQEYGDYFAWGETQPKDTYTENSYNSAVGEATVLPSDYDAATANWGEKWQMPSQEQAKELTQNTTAEWTTLDDVVGLKVTSNANGNSIFLPAAGYRYSTGTYYPIVAVYYWTRSYAGYGQADKIYIRNANFNNDWSSAWNYSGNIYEGLPVRPVRKQ